MKKILLLIAGFIGFVIISIAMQSSQLNFDDIIREFKGNEETENVLYLILKFIIGLAIGFFLIYYCLKTFLPSKKKYLKIIISIVFFILLFFRIYHFINYDENLLINRTSSENWILNYEKAICFRTPEGMDKLVSDENDIVKSYKDENLTVIFAEETYDNYTVKSNIDILKVESILKKQTFDITKLQLDNIELLEEKSYGNIKRIVLQANLNNRGFARIYVIERNTDITSLTILMKKTPNSEKAFGEFLKNLEFLK